MQLGDCLPGELVYTYTIVFSNGYDIQGNVVGTEWELQQWSPLIVVGPKESDPGQVYVTSERGVLDLHHSILVTNTPDPEWFEE